MSSSVCTAVSAFPSTPTVAPYRHGQFYQMGPTFKRRNINESYANKQHASHIKGYTLSVVRRNDMRALIKVHLLLRIGHPDKPLLGSSTYLDSISWQYPWLQSIPCLHHILALDTCRQWMQSEMLLNTYTNQFTIVIYQLPNLLFLNCCLIYWKNYALSGTLLPPAGSNDLRLYCTLLKSCC